MNEILTHQISKRLWR